MNGVILTAVLSALNSGLFASSRMVMALATRGDAPGGLARLNGRGVPVRAILLSTAFGYAAVVMNYVSPEHVFAFLVDSYGTVAIFVYLLIALAELRLRRAARARCTRAAAGAHVAVSGPDDGRDRHDARDRRRDGIHTRPAAAAAVWVASAAVMLVGYGVRRGLLVRPAQERRASSA